MRRQCHSLTNEEHRLDKELRKSLREGNTLAFKRLVKGGVNVNSKHNYWYNSTLLHETVMQGKEELVEILLQNKANVNSKNDDDRTALHIASKAGLKNIVNMLLKHGADVNAQTTVKQTSLHLAAWKGRDEIVKILVDSGANVNLLDQDGWLPIHWALRLKKENMVEYFILNGSLINKSTGKENRSPLVTALVERQYKIACLFLKHGADCAMKQKANETISSIIKDSRYGNKEKIELIQAFIKCGISCSKFDLDHVINSCNKVCTFNKVEKQLLMLNRNDSVRKLTEMCRTSLRNNLVHCSGGKSIYRHVQQLPIPEILKEYLTFEGTFAVL